MAKGKGKAAATAANKMAAAIDAANKAAEALLSEVGASASAERDRIGASIRAAAEGGRSLAADCRAMVAALADSPEFHALCVAKGDTLERGQLAVLLAVLNQELAAWRARVEASCKASGFKGKLLTAYRQDELKPFWNAAENAKPVVLELAGEGFTLSAKGGTFALIAPAADDDASDNADDDASDNADDDASDNAGGGQTHHADLSPAEVALKAAGSALESSPGVLFGLMRSGALSAACRAMMGDDPGRASAKVAFVAEVLADLEAEIRADGYGPMQRAFMARKAAAEAAARAEARAAAEAAAAEAGKAAEAARAAASVADAEMRKAAEAAEAKPDSVAAGKAARKAAEAARAAGALAADRLADARRLAEAAKALAA